MIKSISFPLDGTGYIYEKPQKPECPSKPYYRHRYGKSWHPSDNDKDEEWLERYNADMKEYRKELAWYKRHKDDYISGKCSTNLIGKTFTFEQDKVNILFGPNGSGKSTIIKAIAGTCGCKDGLTKPLEPFKISKALDEPYTPEVVGKTFKMMALNTCEVEWDGTPVYFDNFKETETHSRGLAGNLVGSLINSMAEEIDYILSRDKISAGQKNLWLMHKVVRIAKNKTSLKKIIDHKIQPIINGNNDVWISCYQSQYKYWEQFPNFATESAPTILFDEIDSNLDIETAWTLHHDFLPKLNKELGCQLILVSHNPLVLTKDIMGNTENYNLISLDPEYTKAVKDKLGGVTF